MGFHGLHDTNRNHLVRPNPSNQAIPAPPRTPRVSRKQNGTISKIPLLIVRAEEMGSVVWETSGFWNGASESQKQPQLITGRAPAQAGAVTTATNPWSQNLMPPLHPPVMKARVNGRARRESIRGGRV